MATTVVLSLVLSGVVGLTLGVFGGGGSTLAVPILVYVTRVAPATAIAMSLAIVGATSLAASLAHHRRGQVRFGVALVFGAAGFPTAVLGAGLTHLVSGRVLMVLFAGLMVVVGIGMLVNGRGGESTERGRTSARLRTVQTLLAGGGVGAITGFLGVGGGFLIVPALIAFAGLGMREAIGTSLLVIAINSAAGFVGHLGTGGLDFGLVAILTLASVVGAVVGERTGRSVSVEKLRRGFAVFVIALGIAVAASSVIGGMAEASATGEHTTPRSTGVGPAL